MNAILRRLPHHIRAKFLSCVMFSGAAVVGATPALGQCEQKLVPGDTTGLFGNSVALDGGWALVGAAQDSTAAISAGAAYFYQRSPSGWAETQQVTASDAAGPIHFGSSVSISGSMAVIGAPRVSDQGLFSGAAYVFEYTSGAWSERAKLLAPDARGSHQFGRSVSISGDTAVVGSSRGAYLFERMPGLGWTFVNRITSSNHSRGVAVSGTHILAGYPVEAWERTGQTWTYMGDLAPSGDSGYFGTSISISGDRAAIGGTNADGLSPSSGTAYVFEWNGSAWLETDRLLASDGSTNDHFGTSVAMSGERLWVGAYLRDGPLLNSGAVYMFESDGTTWNETGRLDESNAGENHYFGASVALAGDSAIVGSWGTGGTVGAVYTYSVGDYTSFALVYCYCDAGAPCGNEDADAGCMNVTGHGAEVRVCGTPSVMADDLLISASGVLPNVSGLFFMGGGGGDQIPFGDGQRCVFSGGQGVKRFRPSNGGAAGIISLGPGIAAISEMRFGPGTIAAGRTWNFQCWYRDPIGPCGSGYNTSSAVSVTFAP